MQELDKQINEQIQHIEHLPVDIYNPYGIEVFLCKIIRAGQKEQYFNFSQPQFRGYQTFRSSYEKSIDSVKRDDSLNRTRNQMILLIDCNVTPYSKFMTLTFAIPVLDRDEAFKMFNQFRQDFKRKFGYPLKYVLVAERQKKRGAKEGNEGSWHFHLVVFNERKLPFKDLKSIWGKYGSVDIKKIDYSHNLGVYMAKYLTKEVMEINKKGYTSSRELIHPTVEYLPHNYSPKKLADYESTYPLYNPNDENTINLCSFKEYHTPQGKPIDIVELAQSYFGVDKVEVVK